MGGTCFCLAADSRDKSTLNKVVSIYSLWVTMTVCSTGTLQSPYQAGYLAGETTLATPHYMSGWLPNQLQSITPHFQCSQAATSIDAH